MRFLSLACLAVMALGCSRPGAEAKADAPVRFESAVVPAEPAPAPAPAEKATPVETTPVAIVELFTSEGCSSCPPADSNLADIAAERQKNVFALSFHVDYWNDLGWRDPFSDAKYSARQRQYARALGSGRVYTPQMLVNGSDDFVGSRVRASRRAIAGALERPATASVALKVEPSERSVVVHFDVAGRTDGAVLNLAVVQSARDIDVPRGENAGRKLSHANVVRAFETVELEAPRGREVVLLPRGVEWERSALVAYVQDRRSMEVRGASSLAGGAVER